jgi:hypothetical protein
MPPPRSRPIFLSLAAAVGGAALLAGPAGGQHVEDPVLPRGALLFQIEGLFTQAAGAFGDGGGRPFGSSFFVPATPATFPALEALQTEIRELTDRPDLGIRLGELRGRFEVHEEVLPLRAGYGLLDRVSLGVTVPFVRRRTDARLFLDAEGANLGARPGSDEGVSAFRTDARAALDALRAGVLQICDEGGEESDDCLAGRAAEARVAGFLELLDAAWDGTDAFPLAGSDAGDALRSRWGQARQDLAAWGAQGPETLPLSTRALDETFFRNRLVDPIWGSGGFPVETPEAVLLLGDVEAHLAVGLLRILPEGSRPGVRSAVEATARFATGPSDSLSLVTPLEPPRGYAGGGLRFVTDLILPEARAGALLTLQWTTFLDREVVLLAADPESPWEPDTRRTLVSGAPGDRLTLGIAPRWSIVPGLSLGGGYEWHRSGEGRWSGPAGGPAPFVPAATHHRGALELRFAGWSTPVVEDMWFPVELRARVLWAFSGSEGAPRERRVEAGARVLRRR